MLNTINATKCHWLSACLLLTMPAIAFADESSKTTIVAQAQKSLSKTWASSNYELYIPINTWHNRSFYSAEKIDSFNEQPWGLGLGKYRYDEDGDWNGFYAMAFQDSHRRIEPVFGFGFEKMWYPTENLRLGAGYTVGFTMRQDIHYMPLPGIAPLLSVEYKQLALQSTYIPGGRGSGNVLFTWLRWQFN